MAPHLSELICGFVYQFTRLGTGDASGTYASNVQGQESHALTLLPTRRACVH